ncbi:unnamed protein product [Phytophthora lilii]|uniref:Unnamed protein product n=1 Tax=Phytophthora lilii TaxID=2077276 RepID=A0A9W6U6J4_9STRA|nr:unnamed protein product [Phytophthora lilii]
MRLASLSSRHARRIRKAEQKEQGSGGDRPKAKKAARKKAVKLATLSMEVAASRNKPAAAPAEAKEATEEGTRAEAKATTEQQAQECVNEKSETNATEEPTEPVPDIPAPSSTGDIIVEEVVADMVTSVAWSEEMADRPSVIRYGSWTP